VTLVLAFYQGAPNVRHADPFDILSAEIDSGTFSALAEFRGGY
jgi:hypothetical protein